jgi:hypothetical protein
VRCGGWGAGRRSGSARAPGRWPGRGGRAAEWASAGRPLPRRRGSRAGEPRGLRRGRARPRFPVGCDPWAREPSGGRCVRNRGPPPGQTQPPGVAEGRAGRRASGRRGRVATGAICPLPPLPRPSFRGDASCSAKSWPKELASWPGRPRMPGPPDARSPTPGPFDQPRPRIWPAARSAPAPPERSRTPRRVPRPQAPPPPAPPCSLPEAAQGPRPAAQALTPRPLPHPTE